VLNKADLMPEEERAAVCQEVLRRLDWRGPYFMISALSGLGVRELCERVMARLERQADE
jgi:GTP-binding protein